MENKKDNLVKQVSVLLCVVGLILLVWTFTVSILQNSFTLTRYATIGLMTISIVVSYIGMKKTGFLIQLFHIFISYSCLSFSLVQDPISIAAVVFLIITYFLCREYEFLVKHKILVGIFLLGYVVDASLSVILFKKTVTDLVTFNFLCVFVIAFLETILKKNERDYLELVDKGEKIIEKLEKHNDGIIEKLERIEKHLIEKEEEEDEE